MLKKSFRTNIKITIRINDKIRDENMQYYINKEAAQYHYYHQIKLIKMNILRAKKYYHLIKVD